MLSLTELEHFKNLCSFVEEGINFEPWWEVLEQMQEIWNRQRRSQDADSFRCTRVSLWGKCSLGRTLSSSMNFSEIRLVCISCLHINFIYICIIFKWSTKLTWFVRLASAL